MTAFDSLLVANRGEIAVRVLRTAKEMGLRTIAIVSEVDTRSLAAKMADEVIVVGPAPAILSYLNHEAVLGAAKKTGAGAIHPGYGFLSENSTFARKVIAAGITWVGPSPDSIETMGDKSRARTAAVAAGVPTLSGTDGPIQEGDDLAALGGEIGFPLVVKASAGGGGRGIRVVQNPSELISSVQTAQAEALASFKSSEVYLERFVTNARHVEVQIIGDGKSWVHIGDRDCSFQRRQQKLLEEGPAPGIPDAVRDRMRNTAIELARQSGYIGVGTIEFLYDSVRKEAAFIEMNTRLQVEHPVTEMITGLDLVKEQIRIAQGEPLGYAQDDIKLSGHAIEFRINAENPAQNFMPSPGFIDSINFGAGTGTRFDFGISAGETIAPFYDSLLGKIIVWHSDRKQAIARAERVLNETVVTGVHTTIRLLKKLVATEAFKNVEHSTTFIESNPTILEEEK